MITSHLADGDDDNSVSQIDPDLVNRISFSPEDSKAESDPNTPGNLSVQNLKRLSDQTSDIHLRTSYDNASEHSSDVPPASQEQNVKYNDLSNGFVAAQALDGVNHKEPANSDLPKLVKSSTNGENRYM